MNKVNNLLLIDSDILIDVGRNDKIVVERLNVEKLNFDLAISSITQMELIVGCRNKTELKYLENFLEDFNVITVNFEISQKAVELLKLYRLSHGLQIADSLIASTALVINSYLLTKNQRDFKFIDELKLLKFP